MHINELPHDILAPVLWAVQPTLKSRPAHVKDGLRLLSVCKRWREVALPAVYDTVFTRCDAEDCLLNNGVEKVCIETMLDLAAEARCLHMARRMVLDVYHRCDSLLCLNAAATRLREAADVWPFVRRLELRVHRLCRDLNDLGPPTADLEDDIASVTGALAALLPGLREVSIDDSHPAHVSCMIYGRLVGLYSGQLQVLHTRHLLAVPHDRLFARLRDVSIAGFGSEDLEYRLPRLDPDVVETLELEEFTANDMWSMFCTKANVHAITFQRLANLSLQYCQGYTGAAEHPWALQFPAAERVRIACYDAECPSMENAVFPARLESLNLTAGLALHRAMASAKVQVLQYLTLCTDYSSDADNAKIDIVNRILAVADTRKDRGLRVDSTIRLPPELVTYTRLTHLYLCGPTGVDDLMEHIHRQPLLQVFAVDKQLVAGIPIDFSIPACAEHEPIMPFDTQIRELHIYSEFELRLYEEEISMVKYLLLRIPTLRQVIPGTIPTRLLRDFVDEYVQWYPHLASVKFVIP